MEISETLPGSRRQHGDHHGRQPARAAARACRWSGCCCRVDRRDGAWDSVSIESQQSRRERFLARDRAAAVGLLSAVTLAMGGGNFPPAFLTSHHRSDVFLGQLP